jgi:hypothetical protein
MPKISQKRRRIREIRERHFGAAEQTIRKVLSDVERVDERADAARREIADGARPKEGRFTLRENKTMTPGAASSKGKASSPKPSEKSGDMTGEAGVSSACTSASPRSFIADATGEGDPA